MSSVKRKRKTNSISNLYGAIACIKDNIEWIKQGYGVIPSTSTKEKEIERYEKALKELQYPKNQKLGYTKHDPQWNEIIPYGL